VRQLEHQKHRRKFILIKVICLSQSNLKIGSEMKNILQKLFDWLREFMFWKITKHLPIHHKVIQFIPDEDLVATDAVSSLSETIDWGLILTDIPAMWAQTKGENIKVAIVDTGVDDHIDLEGQILAKYDATGSGMEDSTGHATHVAGTVCALENDMGIIGVAPGSKIYSVKVLGPGGNGTFLQIIEGLKICETLDCDIINLSLGITQRPPEALYTQIKKLVAQGKYIVAAAGNNAGAVNYPAAYPEVIAVAAIDKNKKLAKFSSRGAEVHASAPGVDIYSTSKNNEYRKMSGTSQAAPFFSGICALLLSYARAHPENLKIDSFSDLLKVLDGLCDPDGETHFSGALNDVGFGVPHFANNMPWKKDV